MRSKQLATMFSAAACSLRRLAPAMTGTAARCWSSAAVAPLLSVSSQRTLLSATSNQNRAFSVHQLNARTPKLAGEKVPNIFFKTRVRDTANAEAGKDAPFTWKDQDTAALFNSGPNKRVVVFALPGAYTPTCSNTHLPGYEKHYDAMKACGVDEVYCLSVNDAFVMYNWGKHQGLTEDKAQGNFEKVKLLPDGAVHFTAGMGLTSNWEAFRGFGERSWRYAMVVKDMKIEKIFIEEGYNSVGPEQDPFEVSDAGTMMKYLLAEKAK
jgi:peroxiredoxin